MMRINHSKFMSLFIYENLCSILRHAKKVTTGTKRNAWFQGLFFNHNPGNIFRSYGAGGEIGQKDHKSTDSFIVFALSLAILVSFCTPANGYVLTGPHIFELMIEKLGQAKSLLVHQKLVVYDETGKKEPVNLDETLRYVFPETFRSDISSDKVHRIHIVSKDRALVLMDQKITEKSETCFDFYKDILLYRSRPLLQQRFSFLGMNIFDSSLGRFEDKIAYVVGAQYPDETVTQIWIDKDSFQPFRLIIAPVKEKGCAGGLEVRYYNWRKVLKIWYPGNIKLFQNHVMIREIIVDNIEVNPDFSEELFDIESFKSRYQPFTKIPPGEKTGKELDEIRKTIEEFKKIYKK